MKLMSNSVQSALGSGQGPPEDAEQDDTESLADDTGETTEPPENTQGLAASAQVATKPGIYGNQYELQIDVSRLPRVDQYQAALQMDPNMPIRDITSDVKTVTYYVQTSELAVGADPLATSSNLSQMDDVATSSGLVRRAMSS